MILFFFGEDTFRARQKINELKQKFKKEIDASGNDIAIIDGAKASMEEVNEKTSSSSLFHKKRMVVIEDFFSNSSKSVFKAMVDFLERKKDLENVIIFYEPNLRTEGKKLDPQKAKIANSKGELKALIKDQKELFQALSHQQFVQEFKSLSNSEASIWVKKELEERSAFMSFATINLLVGMVGNDLWRLNNEIEKLINYKKSAHPGLAQAGAKIEIDNKDLDLLVRGKFDENIFALTDALSVRNKAVVIRLLEEELDAGVSEFYLISMIMRQFKILLQIRQALDFGFTSRKIISSLKLHPFVAQKGINQVRNFNREQLKKIYYQTIRADSMIKSGNIEPRLALDLIFSKI
jgi:DNA polymerase-3 subunit delta